MKFSEFTKLYHTELEQFIGNIKSFPWHDKLAYACWLSQTYYYTSKSSRILALAAGNALPEDNDLHTRFVKHVSEETGHEKIALKDLSNLGFDIEQFHELPQTGVFYQNEFYYINKHGTRSLLGWALALEGAAAKIGSNIYEATLKTYGKDCTLFWKVHSQDDIEHIQEALKRVEKLPPEDLKTCLKNIQQTCYLYSQMLDGCTAHTAFKGKAGKIAA